MSMGITEYLTSALLLLLIYLIVLLECKDILRKLWSKKELTWLDKYAVINGGISIVILVSIHEYVFTDELFTKSKEGVLIIMACYLPFYILFGWLNKKRMSDLEKGNT